jgi:lipoyl(octanoyl) transferase
LSIEIERIDKIMEHHSQKYLITFQDLGLIDYKKAWDYQEKCLKDLIIEKEELKKNGKIRDIPQKQVILFCEHPHVYTLGKSGNEHNLLINNDILKRINASFYKINRGGDITYHGPGQIVGYPIIDLDSLNLKIRDYVSMLEESIIGLLSDYGIEGTRSAGATGVWLNERVSGSKRKICAIGVRVSNHVTMHGFALNVNTDLNYFRYINPCGFTDKEITSLSMELGKELDLTEVKMKLRSRIAGIFNIDWIDIINT